MLMMMKSMMITMMNILMIGTGRNKKEVEISLKTFLIYGPPLYCHTPPPPPFILYDLSYFMTYSYFIPNDIMLLYISLI